MTAFRKAIIIFYILLVAVLVAVPLLDGLGTITLKEGTGWLIAQIAVATAVPVAIAAMRTTDFFREDPHDIAHLKKDYLAATTQRDALHLKEMEEVKTAHQKANDEAATELLKWKRLALNPQTKQVHPPSIFAPGAERTQQKP